MHAAIHHEVPKTQRTRNEECDIEAQLNVRLREKVALPLLGKGLCWFHSASQVDAMATKRLSLNKR